MTTAIIYDDRMCLHKDEEGGHPEKPDRIKYIFNKIAILDWDVHHGNATQHMFETDPRVLYISIHRYDNGDFYPGGMDGHPKNVGCENGIGRNVNIGWNINNYEQI